MTTPITGNGNGERNLDPVRVLRSRIFATLAEANASEEQIVELFSQFASQIRNKQLVEEIAKACEISLSRFLPMGKEVLEIYFDLARGQEEMGMISKGWDDPGFRIGDLIKIPNSRAAKFDETLLQIYRLCATNGIGMTFEKNADSIQMCVDGVIYSEGFNKDTFRKTLETLRECIQMIEEMVA